MCAPSATPNKYSVVQVEGSIGPTEKEAQPSPIYRGEEMDNSEIVVLGRSKENESQGGQFEENHGLKESEVIPSLSRCL